MCGVEDNEVKIELKTGEKYMIKSVSEAHYDMENNQYEFEHEDGGYTLINTQDRLNYVIFGKDVKRFTY